MRPEDMIILSIDDHVIEPANMFDAHIPAKFKERAPRLVTDDAGLEHWEIDGSRLATRTAINAVVSWPKEEWGFDPTTTGEMRPGAYDLDERIRDMNRNGILASMCFPSFPGFSGRGLQDIADKDLALAALQAYNDWHIDELAASHPGRFIPLALGPVWELDALIAEVKRVSAKGCKAITMPELPHLQGLPSYHSEHWFPFWKAVCDEGVTVCLHIGGGFQAINMAPDVPIDNLMVIATQVSVLAAQDILWGPSLRNFPDLRIAWSEGGIGWIPFFLDRSDRHYTNQKWTRQEFGGKLPSEVFREHSLVCFITDPTSLKLRREIGIDMIAFEADYPHSDCLWPDAPEFLLSELNNVGATDEEIEKISWKNTARFLEWDPFKHIPKDQATVGALRSLATHVDTTIRSRKEWKALYEARLAS